MSRAFALSVLLLLAGVLPARGDARRAGGGAGTVAAGA